MMRVDNGRQELSKFQKSLVVFCSGVGVKKRAEPRLGAPPLGRTDVTPSSHPIWVLDPEPESDHRPESRSV